MKKNCKGCGNKAHSQDELHGKGIRVFNEHANKTRQRVLRCTRCGNEEIAGMVPDEAKKAEVQAAQVVA